jgi:hypothetical protein
MSLTECTENTEDAVAVPALKSVEIRRATSCEARERIEEKEELKSELSVQSVGENSNPDGTRSVT